MIQWLLLRSLLNTFNNYNDNNNNNTNISSDVENSQMSCDQQSDETKELNGNGVDHLSQELLDISIDEQSLSNSTDTNESQTQERPRTIPTIHVATDAPLCPTCEELESPFFNAHCLGCREILTNMDTSIAQIFAIMRQWVPQTQQCIELLVREVLRRGAHIDDRDGLTDMTLLHYVCKSGSSGVGDVDMALRTVRYLVESFDADVSLRCRWTDMSAIHYAVRDILLIEFLN